MSNLYSVRFTFELHAPDYPYKSKIVVPPKGGGREIDKPSYELLDDIENCVFREGGVATIKTFSQCKISDDAQEVHVITHPKDRKSHFELNRSLKRLSHLNPRVIQEFSSTPTIEEIRAAIEYRNRHKKNTPE